MRPVNGRAVRNFNSTPTSTSVVLRTGSPSSYRNPVPLTCWEEAKLQRLWTECSWDNQTGPTPGADQD